MTARDEAAETRRRSQAGLLMRPPYTVTCPKCQAAPHELCRTPENEPRVSAHPTRFDVEDQQLTLDA